VDDDDIVRGVTAELLSEHGYHVMQASDGESALRLFELHHHQIDLVILDIIMPKMNGDVVSTGVRRINHDVPIIFMTGYDKEKMVSGEDHLENCIVLSKPFQYEGLSHTLRTLLD